LGEKRNAASPEKASGGLKKKKKAGNLRKNPGHRYGDQRLNQFRNPRIIKQQTDSTPKRDLKKGKSLKERS